MNDESNKKRKHYDNNNEISPDRKYKSLLASAQHRPNNNSADGDRFIQTKTGIWQQHMEALNAQLKERVAATKTPEEAVMASCEYLRIRKEVSQKYHPPLGYVIAMGSDDASQLGISQSADDDKKDEYPPTLILLSSPDICQVAAGGVHSLALTNDGKVYSWGVNDDDALGREVLDSEHHLAKMITDFPDKDKDQIVAIDAGDSHSLFLSLEGRLYMCGMYKDMDSGKFANLREGQVLKSKNTTQKRPVEIPFPEPIWKVSAGASANAAILQSGQLYTWGMGHCGELARSKSMGAKLVKDEHSGQLVYDVGKLFIGKEVEEEEVDVETGKTKNYMAYKYNFDLIAEKFLKPAPVEWAMPAKYTVLDVACGEIHLLVLARRNGEPETGVYSSGHNVYGQLGHGDLLQRHQLTKISKFDGEEIAQVAAGSMHSLALNCLGNAIWAWGRSDYGQLGLSSKMAESGGCETTPQQVPFPSEVGDMLFTDISAGERTSAAVLANGDVYTWGFNTTGATGHKVRTENGSEDIMRPKKLDVMRLYKKKDPSRGTDARVLNVAGGGQHSLMVIERFL